MKKYFSVMTLIIIQLSGCASPQVANSFNKDKALATQNIPSGLNNMGSRYQFGDGVEQDYKKAFSLYGKASNRGLAIAKTNLGYMYDYGLGIKRNKSKAISLYKSASNLGDPRGMINLGEMYRTGDHIEKSLSKACELYEKARFVTQASKDRQVKWASRGALDKFCK